MKELRKAERPLRTSSRVVTGWLRLEGASGELLLQPPAQGRGSWSWLLKAVSIWTLKEEGPSGREELGTGRLYWQERPYWNRFPGSSPSLKILKNPTGPRPLVPADPA